MIGFSAMFGGLVSHRVSGSCAKFSLTNAKKIYSAVRKPLPLPLLTQVGTISDKRVKDPVIVNDPKTPEELAEFAQEVKMWRSQHQFSQNAIASEIGIQPQRFARFERADMTVGAMQKIAELINQWWLENEVFVSHSKAKLSDSQVAVLEESYAAEPKLSFGQTKALARKLDLPEDRIANWYKWRKQIEKDKHSTADPENELAKEMREFAVEFRTRRSRLGISQRAIAKATGRLGQGLISRFENLSLTPRTMRSMQETLLKGLEIAEAEGLSKRNSMQKEGAGQPIFYLSEDKKERLTKLVEDNMSKDSKLLAKQLAKEFDLPVKTVSNFILTKQANQKRVKGLVNLKFGAE